MLFISLHSFLYYISVFSSRMILFLPEELPLGDAWWTNSISFCLSENIFNLSSFVEYTFTEK